MLHHAAAAQPLSRNVRMNAGLRRTLRALRISNRKSNNVHFCAFYAEVVATFIKSMADGKIMATVDLSDGATVAAFMALSPHVQSIATL